MLVKLRLAPSAIKVKRGPNRLGIALGMLVEAYRYSASMRSNRWQYAIELDEFRHEGVTRSELRWLLASGLVLHAQEISDASAAGRAFVGLPKHLVPGGSCFVLSDEGIVQLGKCARPREHRAINGNGDSLLEHAIGPIESVESVARGDVRDSLAPEWDAVRRELRLEGVVVKQFRSRAANQVAILAAFQEDGWPARIDDPLPPAGEQEPSRRLSDAIRCLNGSQANELIRFRGDGTGKGVLWELQEKTLVVEF